jgi:hypothetical protein
MLYYINRLRWRLARFIAPDPILAGPVGEGQVYILIRDEQDGVTYAWVAAKTFDLNVETQIPALGDDLALGNWMPSTGGTFSGTV